MKIKYYIASAPCFGVCRGCYCYSAVLVFLLLRSVFCLTLAILFFLKVLCRFRLCLKTEILWLLRMLLLQCSSFRPFVD